MLDVRPIILLLVLFSSAALAQTAPTPEELRIYAGLHEAAAKGDVAEIEKLIAEGERPNIQDSRSRTPLHVAVYLKRHDAARALIAEPGPFTPAQLKGRLPAR